MAASVDEFTKEELKVIHRYQKALDKNARIASYFATQHKVVDYESQRLYDRTQLKYFGQREKEKAKTELTVHIVPHTHDDVGWRKTFEEYYSGSNVIMDERVAV